MIDNKGNWFLSYFTIIHQIEIMNDKILEGYFIDLV